MPLRPDQLSRDPAVLARMVIDLTIENEKLLVALNVFKEMIFGAKSEKISAVVPEQGRLDLGDLATDVTPVAAGHTVNRLDSLLPWTWKAASEAFIMSQAA